jgi:hypothetical protein
MRPIIEFGVAALAGALSLSTPAGDLDPPGSPTPTPGPEPRTAISEESTPGDDTALFRIATAGSYYLPADIAGTPLMGKSGIVIEASDVTIDLGGFALLGFETGLPTLSLSGILASGEIENITILNGTVRGWGQAGMDLSSATGTNVVSVVSRDNGEEGILCGPGAAIRSCTVQSNGGAGIHAATDSQVTNSVARDCAPGITAEAGSIVEACVASSNTSEGIRGFGATISRCRSDGNAGRGFVLHGGMLVESAATSNATHGVEAYADFVVLNSVFQQNSGVGICAADLTGATTGGRIEGNSSTGNECGVWTAAESEGLLIVRNHASNNEINYDISGTNIVGPILIEIDSLAPTDPWANFSF